MPKGYHITDPEFAAKAADIVGLCLNPPENALVDIGGREAKHAGVGTIYWVCGNGQREDCSRIQEYL